MPFVDRYDPVTDDEGSTTTTTDGYSDDGWATEYGEEVAGYGDQRTGMQWQPAPYAAEGPTTEYAYAAALAQQRQEQQQQQQLLEQHQQAMYAVANGAGVTGPQMYAAGASQIGLAMVASPSGAIDGNDDDDEPRDPPGSEEDAEPVLDDAIQDDEDHEPTDAEILGYCEWLGVDPVADRPLMWIVREALKAPLPEDWRMYHADDHEVYYFNVATGESMWDHPMDAFYKALYKQEKAKLLRRRQHMRHYSGSLEVVPLAHFFTELADEEGAGDSESDAGESTTAPPSPSAPPAGATKSKRPAPWRRIPESLIDAIDFRMFVDPVVLPSGRTVSRHIIIDSKWRDPFTREYVENSRLVSNVDKRSEVDAWLAKAVSFFFAHLAPTVEGLRRALRILPKLLDKEDETSLKGQTMFLNWLRQHSDRRNVSPRNATVAATSATTTTTAAAPPKRGSLAQDRRTAQRGQPHRKASEAIHQAPAAPPPVLVDVLATELNPDTELKLLFDALLTMSTSSSREALYYILSRHPQLGANPAFQGFDAEVLHMLHLGQEDVARIATAIGSSIEGSRAAMMKKVEEDQRSFGDSWACPPSGGGAGGGNSRSPGASRDSASGSTTTTAVNHNVLSNGLNGHGLVSPPPPPSRPPQAGTSAAVAQTSEAPGSPSAGGSAKYATSNSEHHDAFQWVDLLARRLKPSVHPLKSMDFPPLLHMVFSMHDTTAPVATPADTLAVLLLGGKEWPTALGQCSNAVITKLLGIGIEAENVHSRIKVVFDVAWSGGERCLDRLQAADAKNRLLHGMHALAQEHSLMHPTRPNTVALPGDQSVDLLGAILVYHDGLKLEELNGSPSLALRVAFNLLPRLTRSQWRPKHFEATVTHIITLTQQYPILAWRSFQSTGALFLLRELSRKKRDEARLKIGGLEAAERRQQQVNAIHNWGLLASRLAGRVAAETRTAAAEAWKRHHPVPGKKTDPSISSASATMKPAGPTATPGNRSTRLPNLRPTPRGSANPKDTATASSRRVVEKEKEVPTPPPLLARLDAQVVEEVARAQRLSQKRDAMHTERATTIVTALQTLLGLRIKTKPPRGALKSSSMVVEEPSDSSPTAGGTAAGTPSGVPPLPAGVPPLAAPRRGSSNGSGRRSYAAPPVAPPPAPPTHASVSSSCPTLPPIHTGNSM